MRIGFIGTKIRIDAIKKVINLQFPEIEAEFYTDEDYHFSQTTREYLEQLKCRVDGVIFGGAVQYKLYKELLYPDISCMHVRKDSASLMNALLAMAYQKRDCKKISVDNYAMSMINQVLEDCGSPELEFHVLRTRFFYGHEPRGYEEFYQEHKRLFEDRQVDGCITTMSFVYQKLKADGVPVVYSIPTKENIVQTIYQMKEEIRLRENRQGDALAVLILRLVPQNQLGYHTQEVYLETGERLKAVKELNYFAKNLNALLLIQSDEQFVIFVEQKELMRYTNGLQSFQLLNLLNDNTQCNFSLGIGFAAVLSEAYANAMAAVRKASMCAGSCTYAAYGRNAVIGPLDFIGGEEKELDYEQEKVQSLAMRTGLSSQKLFQIYHLTQQKKKWLFSAEELAKNLGITIRTSNRILSALEAAGLAKLSCTVRSGKAGRPRHVYEILLQV